MSRAVSYLEMELRNVYRPHAVAMTTYALVLAKSPQRFKANQKLTQMALYDSGEFVIIPNRPFAAGSHMIQNPKYR